MSFIIIMIISFNYYQLVLSSLLSSVQLLYKLGPSGALIRACNSTITMGVISFCCSTQFNDEVLGQ